MPVAFNPYDPNQAKFLSALALGEVGPSGGEFGIYTGTGGYDLSGAPKDPWDFPEWSGFGNSHAAGTFQFQPGTWKPYQQKYGLDFDNPSDQAAAAWYLAQDTFKKDTGRELADALAAGDYAAIQASKGLQGQWPSITGNGASPGIAEALGSGEGARLDYGSGGTISDDRSPGGFVDRAKDAVASVADKFNPFKSLTGFARWGLLIIGVVILLIALWNLLSDSGVVPSPGEVAKGAAGVALAVA